MGLPEYEDSLARAQTAEEKEAALTPYKEAVYQELVTELKQKLTEHKGHSKSNKIHFENFKVLLDLLEGAKELNLIPDNPDDPHSDYKITGQFVQKEEFVWKKDPQTRVKNTFQPGTEVDIHCTVKIDPEKPIYSGTVGDVITDRTVALVANKYSGILRKIDMVARIRSKIKSS